MKELINSVSFQIQQQRLLSRNSELDFNFNRRKWWLFKEFLMSLNFNLKNFLKRKKCCQFSFLFIYVHIYDFDSYEDSPLPNSVLIYQKHFVVGYS